MKNIKWYERLKELRIDNDYTQAELAKKLNISTKTLQRYENGTGEPPVSTLLELSLIFRKSIDYITCNPIYDDLISDEMRNELKENVIAALEYKKKN